jgi:gamma-glutamylcyclotransferase (GGCT)/AIG2-like uncharacterized protein YtfP
MEGCMEYNKKQKEILNEKYINQETEYFYWDEVYDYLDTYEEQTMSTSRWQRYLDTYENLEKEETKETIETDINRDIPPKTITNPVNIYVYGTLRTNEINGYYLEHALDAIYLEEIQLTGFIMYDLGSFPMCIKSKHKPNNITVEKYIINKEDLEVIDQIEGHPYFFKREEINRYDTKGNIHEGYIYLGDENLIQDYERIQSGDWQGTRKLITWTKEKDKPNKKKKQTKKKPKTKDKPKTTKDTQQKSEKPVPVTLILDQETRELYLETGIKNHPVILKMKDKNNRYTMSIPLIPKDNNDYEKATKIIIPTLDTKGAKDSNLKKGNLITNLIKGNNR